VRYPLTDETRRTALRELKGLSGREREHRQDEARIGHGSSFWSAAAATV
jgi:hypothetical protein